MQFKERHDLDPSNPDHASTMLPTSPYRKLLAEELNPAHKQTTTFKPQQIDSPVVQRAARQLAEDTIDQMVGLANIMHGACI